MAVFAVPRLLKATSAKKAAQATAIVAAVVLVFWLVSPLFAGLGRLNLLIFFIGVAGGCMFAGVPVAFAFGLATFAYLALSTDTPMPAVGGADGRGHVTLDFAGGSAVCVFGFGA